MNPKTTHIIFYIKMCLFICVMVCIILGIVFLSQNLTRQNELLEAKIILNQKELEEEINEVKSRFEATEIVYQIRQYIDSVSAQIDTDFGSSEYTDGIYDYIYYSDYPDGKDSWLIIC